MGICNFMSALEMGVSVRRGGNGAARMLGMLPALCAHASCEFDEQKAAPNNSKKNGLPRKGSPPFLLVISPAVHRACEGVELIS